MNHYRSAVGLGFRFPSVVLHLLDEVLSLLRKYIAKARLFREYDVDDRVRHQLRVGLPGQDLRGGCKGFHWGEVFLWVEPVRSAVYAPIVEARGVEARVDRRDLDSERRKLGLQPLGKRLQRVLAGAVARAVRHGQQPSQRGAEHDLPAPLRDHLRREELGESDTAKKVDLEHRTQEIERQLRDGAGFHGA